VNDTRPEITKTEAQALDELLDSIAADQEERWQEHEQVTASLAAARAERIAAERAERARRYNVTTRYSIAPLTRRG
jgi:uncharacterized membrane protein